MRAFQSVWNTRYSSSNRNMPKIQNLWEYGTGQWDTGRLLFSYRFHTGLSIIFTGHYTESQGLFVLTKYTGIYMNYF